MSWKLHGNNERIKYLREAASVRRSHTVPIIGEMTDGHHSFNMICMGLILFPNMSRNLMIEIVKHDLLERLTGDFPATMRNFGIIDTLSLNCLESKILDVIFGPPPETLTEEESMILRGLDILELYCFCRDQIFFGNQHVRRMMSRCILYIEKSEFPVQIKTALYDLEQFDWNMTPDLGENCG